MRCVCGGEREKPGISTGNLQGVVLINVHQLLSVHDNWIHHARGCLARFGSPLLRNEYLVDC